MTSKGVGKLTRYTPSQKALSEIPLRKRRWSYLNTESEKSRISEVQRADPSAHVKPFSMGRFKEKKGDR